MSKFSIFVLSAILLFGCSSTPEPIRRPPTLNPPSYHSTPSRSGELTVTINKPDQFVVDGSVHTLESLRQKLMSQRPARVNVEFYTGPGISGSFLDQVREVIMSTGVPSVSFKGTHVFDEVPSQDNRTEKTKKNKEE